MLHPYQEASRTRLSVPHMKAEVLPGWELFSMLGEIHEWLQSVVPYIQSSLLKKDVSVYILFRNVAYSPNDFWDLFGRSMARINQTWPICAFGTAENQETVRLTATMENNGLCLIQQSISGKSTDLLRTLCLQIDCVDNATTERLGRLLMATNWDTDILALNNWQDAEFLRHHHLFVQTDPPGFFCYGSIDQKVTTRELLFSLDFRQKMILWTAFLKDGFDPAEFAWILDEIAQETLDNRLEWELALWEALNQLGFQMVNQQKTFELFDATGRRRYFGADGGSAAERVFLKILFPLND